MWTVVSLVDIRVVNVHESIDKLKAIYRACGSVVGRAALAASGGSLMEPLMSVEVLTPAEMLGAVVADISGTRRGSVGEIRHLPESGEAVIEAQVPVSSMLGYSNGLRGLTGGNASFTMELGGHRQVSKSEEAKIIKDMLYV